MSYNKEPPKEYPNKYEKFRDLGWKSYEDCAEVISFFTPHDMDLTNKDTAFIKDYNNNKLPKGVNINGRVKVVQKPDYKATMNIKEAFTRVQELMCTKSGGLRATMTKLKPWEVNDLASLLHHLRSEWVDGERGNVELTFNEYYMLKPKKK